MYSITSTPLHGSFLTKSNWSDITRGNKVYGLQSNGTLWSIAIPHYQWRREVGTFDQKIPSWTIEQIGSDDDWAAISGSMTHCLALKRNGTLWGWGDSGLGELGPGPDRVTNGPIRIGKDSDWVSIFADISSSCGVKADGTIWRWGSLYEPVAGSSRQNLPQKHLKPLRCSLAGTNYVSIQSPGSFSMGLRDDGALFLFGTWHRKLFDCVLEGFNSPPKQVGDPEWRYFSMNHFAGAGLKRDGTLWIEAMNYWEELRRRPSQYNDWMALGLSEVDLVALATDGTLCSWSTGTRTWDLCVTRRAQWSLNIFEQGR